MALCGLVLVFVQYLPVGVIIDFQKPQDYILYRVDKLEKKKMSQRGGKGEENGDKGKSSRKWVLGCSWW